jgi:predicted GNAT superfamily acetyltransferase
MIFEEATAADYPAILELNQAAIPEVSHLDEAALAALHRQAVMLTVARSGGEIAGFMLILREGADYGSPNYQYFASNYEAFHYVDRIVVSEHFRRQGVGAGLYALLFEAAEGSPRVTCEVNVRPPNPGSLGFHESLGFVTVGAQDTDGGIKRVALMVREAPEQSSRPGSK